MSLLVVGSVALDSILTPFGETACSYAITHSSKQFFWDASSLARAAVMTM